MKITGVGGGIFKIKVRSTIESATEKGEKDEVLFFMFLIGLIAHHVYIYWLF